MRYSRSLDVVLLTHIRTKQGVALTGRNRTVPPCSVGRRTGHAPGQAAADRPRALQTTTTDDSVQNNTDPLGKPVIRMSLLSQTNAGMITEYKLEDRLRRASVDKDAFATSTACVTLTFDLLSPECNQVINGANEYSL